MAIPFPRFNFKIIFFQNFEDFIVGHFINRAHDILEAYNAYMEEGKVECLVKGGV